MEKELEEIFDQFLEGKIEEKGIAYLEEIKEVSPEQYQEFLELVAFEERVNQELKEQRSGELLADVIIKEIRKNETNENVELADNVLKKLRETPSRKLRKVATTKRRVKKKKKSNFTPWLVAAMVAISFAIGMLIFKKDNGSTPLISLVSGEVFANGKSFTSGTEFNDISLGIRKTATFKLKDGSLVKVEKDSEISFQLHSQNLIVLNKGRLNAKVAKQHNGVLAFETNQARAEILGTEFDLSYFEKKSSLSLMEGKVKFISKKTDKRIIMNAGDKAFVIDNGDISKVLTNRLKLVTLVDQKSGEDLKILNDNEVISLSRSSSSINIKFYLEKAQELRFVINGKVNDKVEKNPPYYLTGNDPDSMDINKWYVRPGNYRIEVQFMDQGKVQFTENLNLKVEP